MKRKQIYFDEKTESLTRQASKREGVNESELVRRAVREYVARRALKAKPFRTKPRRIGIKPFVSATELLDEVDR